MAEKVGKVVLEAVQADCPSNVCPYRTGDQDPLRKKFKEKLEKKLEYRVSDGNEDRALNKRNKELEAAVTQALEWALVGKKLGQKDFSYLKGVLKTPKKQ